MTTQMDPIPFALTGYLDSVAVPGNATGTASWRLTSSPTDCTEEEEAIIPCTTTQPDLAHALLTECQPGDLLRVTGQLALPGTADGSIRLHADTVEILYEAPLSEPPRDEVPADSHGDRNRAIHALAEALTDLASKRTPGEQPDIRINIGPVGINGLDVAHCHSIDVTTATSHKLADIVDALHDSQAPPEDALDPQTLDDLTDCFDSLDLTEIKRTVLKATPPEGRIAVTRALDDMFGDIPVTGIEDTDQ
ncbi:hypothetical protein [Streptomyces umbrinus]|uniref:hypothetical protein n=1 Tax=Streptomyces umbrinus TaxID=67370 RepID=UPI0033C85134